MSNANKTDCTRCVYTDGGKHAEHTNMIVRVRCPGWTMKTKQYHQDMKREM